MDKIWCRQQKKWTAKNQQRQWRGDELNGLNIKKSAARVQYAHLYAKFVQTLVRSLHLLIIYEMLTFLTRTHPVLHHRRHIFEHSHGHMFPLLISNHCHSFMHSIHQFAWHFFPSNFFTFFFLRSVLYPCGFCSVHFANGYRFMPIEFISSKRKWCSSLGRPLLLLLWVVLLLLLLPLLILLFSVFFFRLL